MAFRNECKVVKKAVKKYSPVTGCTKEPREICAPAGCGFKEVRTATDTVGPEIGTAI